MHNEVVEFVREAPVAAVGLTLPSGRRITMAPPTLGDEERLRRQLLERYKAETNPIGRMVSDIGRVLPRACLLSDSGAPNGALDPDARHRCLDWPMRDWTAYLALYDALTNVQEADAEAAREAAKAFLGAIRQGA